MSHFNRPQTKPATSYVNTTRNDNILENKNKDINFSFKYFKEDDEFHIQHSDVRYLQKVIARLHDLCGMSYLGLVTNHTNKSLRFHRIDWNDGSVSRNSFNIPGDEDLFDEAYQFSVSSNEHGRILGFFTNDITFNIVWFDKEHNLYE